MNKLVELRVELPVRVERELCSRFRCTKSHCDACARVCPVPGAVRLVEEGAAEITDECVGCGACASACPNGAIRPIESDSRLAERIRNRVRPGAAFRISCSRAEGRVDLVLPCLSRLTEALLLEPIQGGAGRVELLDPDCSGCGLKQAAPQWNKTLDFSGALCEAAGLGADRVARVPVRSGKATEKRASSGSPHPRRAMFRAIADKWKASGASAAPREGEPEQKPAQTFREIVRQPRENLKRTELLRVLRALPGAKVESKVAPVAGIPLAQLEVKRHCVGCNVCETLCPVGALRRREDEGSFTLDFDPALCTGCGVCEAACFYKAIRLREAVDLSVLFERRGVTLISAARRKCGACQETFLDDSSEFCPSCLVSGRRRDMLARRFLLGGNQSARS